MFKSLFQGFSLDSKRQNPHTIREALVPPATLKIIEIIHGSQCKVKYILLSENTVGRCIENTAEDLKKQVL